MIKRWGRVDVLLTAAGASTGGTVDAIDEAAWDRTFAINVKGTYLWIHTPSPDDRRQEPAPS